MASIYRYYTLLCQNKNIPSLSIMILYNIKRGDFHKDWLESLIPLPRIDTQTASDVCSITETS